MHKLNVPICGQTYIQICQYQGGGVTHSFIPVDHTHTHTQWTITTLQYIQADMKILLIAVLSSQYAFSNPPFPCSTSVLSHLHNTHAHKPCTPAHPLCAASAVCCVNHWGRDSSGFAHVGLRSMPGPWSEDYRC